MHPTSNPLILNRTANGSAMQALITHSSPRTEGWIHAHLPRRQGYGEVATRFPGCDECVALCAQINAETVGDAKEAHNV
jgi:hypothetical protein